MSEPTDRLSKEDLERTLQEKVLPKSRLDELTSHETPKAIVLAGQPGAGKGALVRMAREEFRGDILVIDPDEQRERLPGVRRLQESDPFGWPKATNTDASKLATGLRDEGIKRHVNLVIERARLNQKTIIESRHTLRLFAGILVDDLRDPIDAGPCARVLRRRPLVAVERDQAQAV